MKITVETLNELLAWAHQRAKDAHPDNAGVYRMLPPLLNQIVSAEEDEARRAETEKVIAERDKAEQEAQPAAVENQPEPVVESEPVAPAAEPEEKPRRSHYAKKK